MFDVKDKEITLHQDGQGYELLRKESGATRLQKSQNWYCRDIRGGVFKTAGVWSSLLPKLNNYE